MITWPILPLGANDLTFGVVNYDFTGLTAGELADLPNLEAAIDATLADFGTSLHRSLRIGAPCCLRK